MKELSAKITAGAVAVLGVLVAFGVDLNEVQHAAILGAVAALLPFGAYLEKRRSA